MASQMIRRPIGKAVHLSTIRDPKFKHNRLTAHIILPLERENASNNAVVPFLLRKGFRECPDFTSLNARLAELYGAALDADVSKYGGWQIMEVSIRGLDNRFALENEDISGRCAQLLASVLLDPALEDGLFREQDVALERQYVLDSIEAEINDKRTWALSRCIQTMCAGEPVAVRRYGDAETAGAITRESATQAWRRMLRQAPVEIIFTGAGDSAAAEEIFSKAFAGVDRQPVETPAVGLRTAAEQVREVTETMDLSQSKLVLGMRTGEAATPREINARRLMAALYGGTPFSKLFLNVRERLGLCYYCAARFDVATRLLLVDSGVEAQNCRKAREEILRQLQVLQQGEITDEELHNTKLLVKNSVTTAGDSLSGLESWYLSQILRGQNISPEQDALSIDEITREEVVRAAQAVTADTIYLLTGNQQSGEGA